MIENNFLEKVDQELADWTYFSSFPAEIGGFKKKKVKKVFDNEYDFLHYENIALRNRIIFYYDHDTREYKLRIRLGLVYVCRYEFFARTLDEYEKYIRQYFEPLVIELLEAKNRPLDNLYKAKIYPKENRIIALPEKLQGYELYISPDSPQHITNSSYLLINYVDFSTDSGIGIFYNVYMNTFYSEIFLFDKPIVIYDFDTEEIPELNKIIADKLEMFLKRIKEEASKDKLADNYMTLFM